MEDIRQLHELVNDIAERIDDVRFVSSNDYGAHLFPTGYVLSLRTKMIHDYWYPENPSFPLKRKYLLAYFGTYVYWGYIVLEIVLRNMEMRALEALPNDHLSTWQSTFHVALEHTFIVVVGLQFLYLPMFYIRRREGLLVAYWTWTAFIPFTFGLSVLISKCSTDLRTYALGRAPGDDGNSRYRYDELAGVYNARDVFLWVLIFLAYLYACYHVIYVGHRYLDAFLKSVVVKNAKSVEMGV